MLQLQGSRCNSPCNRFATPKIYIMDTTTEAHHSERNEDTIMMDMMINTAKKNLEVLTEMQKRNEEMVRVLLDHTAKTREQIVATNESLMKIASEQGQAATKYVEDSMKAGREMMEKQVAEAQKAVAAKK